MAKMQSNLADIEVLEALPPDWYAAHITEFEYGDSKASIGRGKPEKMFTFTWEVDEGDFAGRKVMFDTVSLSAKATGFLMEFLDALRWERECSDCGQSFTEARKISKEESKINKSGLGCPHCGSQSPVSWDAGDPAGQAFIGARCQIGVTQEKSKKAGDDKMYNRVEGYAQIK